MAAPKQIDNALRSFVSDGDEVLIPEPSFVCYTPLAMMAGGVPVPLETRMEDGFKLTAETLKKAITPKTKVLIMPFPNNPTGAIMTREDLEEIAAVLRDTNIVVISDEIYCELTYGGKQHVCFAELPGMRERTIVINGFSKSFAMTGWRLGWVMAPREMLKPLVKIHQFGIMSAPTVSQFAGIEALRTGREDIKYMREQYDLRRRFMYYRLQEIGMPCFEPEGAFYIFPSIQKYMDDDEKFCDELLRKKKVAVVPGSAFGESGRRTCPHFVFVFHDASGNCNGTHRRICAGTVTKNAMAEDRTRAVLCHFSCFQNCADKISKNCTFYCVQLCDIIAAMRKLHL